MLPMCDGEGTACLSLSAHCINGLRGFEFIYINAQKSHPQGDKKPCAALTHMARCRVVKIIITTCTDAD